MRPNDLPCPAPDRSPHAPASRLVAGACDTHAHVCGPASRFPYVQERIYTPPDSTLEDYLHLLGALGVERAVLVQPSVYGSDNAALLDALRRVSSGLRGVAVVEPTLSARDAQALHDAGVRGVRLNVVDHNGPRNVVPRDQVAALARVIAPFGWHLEFLVNLDEAPDFVDAVRDLPVDVVVGHFGYPKAGPDWARSASCEQFLRHLDGGRCWVKFTGPYRITRNDDLPYADVEPLAHRLAQVRPDRLLWGTDWPHVMMKKRMPNDGDLTELLTRWLPDPALRAQVLVTNAAALYGFGANERLPTQAAP